MSKKLLKALCFLTSFLCVFCFGGCREAEEYFEQGATLADIELEGEYTRDLAGTTINVFNWGEYIPDGTEGSMDLNAVFTELTGIRVNYTTYESNESMYSKIKGGGVSYDIIIPSD